MLRISLKIFSVTLVVSAVAAAETPGDGFHAGASAYWVQPFGRSLVFGERLRAGTGWGVNLSYQYEHLLLQGEFLKGNFGRDDTYSNPLFLVAKVGYVFGTSDIVPYVTVGVGIMAFGAVGDDAKSGVGYSCEAGVVFFRSKVLKPSIVAQFNFPGFSADYGLRAIGPRSTWVPWTTLGIRLQL